MIPQNEILHIQKLQEQLELLKKAFEDKIEKGEEPERVQPIQRQIRDLENVIRNELSEG